MAEKKTATKKAAPKKSSVEICNCEGVPIREYNSKDHGSDFETLAKEFAEKNGYKIK